MVRIKDDSVLFIAAVNHPSEWARTMTAPEWSHCYHVCHFPRVTSPNILGETSQLHTGYHLQSHDTECLPKTEPLLHLYDIPPKTSTCCNNAATKTKPTGLASHGMLGGMFVWTITYLTYKPSAVTLKIEGENLTEQIQQNQRSLIMPSIMSSSISNATLNYLAKIIQIHKKNKKLLNAKHSSYIYIIFFFYPCWK